MQLEYLDEYQQLKETINELKKEYGCVGMKLSTEDQGNCMDFIDFVNNRLLDDVLPLNVKIGGPDAKNDIKECLRIGASGIIAPMVESPFGVNKFVTALIGLAGKEVMSRLLVSVNLESVSAYEKIDDILKALDTKEINQIVIGTSDLAKSVAKPIDDPQVMEMVKNIAKKSKGKGKIVRIGGVMSIAYNNPDYLRRLLEETNADKVNTSSVCFNVEKVPDLRSTYLKALNFELKLNDFWVALCNNRIAFYKKRVSSLKKRIA